MLKKKKYDKLLLFFSSDATELYEADIYRALALPEDSVLHFRYDTEFIMKSLYAEQSKATVASEEARSLTSIERERILELKGRPGVICFVAGNDQSLKEAEIEVSKRQKFIELTSLRRVVVKDVEIAENTTELNHFYLALKEFVNFDLAVKVSQEQKPLEAFLSAIDYVDVQEDIWSNRVKEVIRISNKAGKAIHEFKEKLSLTKNGSEHILTLGQTLFFNINGIVKRNTLTKVWTWFRTTVLPKEEKVVKPKYDKELKESYYKLRDETNYTVRFSFFDDRGGESKLKVEKQGEEFAFIIPEDLSIGAETDNRNFTLSTSTLTRQESYGSLKIFDKDKPLYRTFIPIKIRRGRLKPFSLAFFTVLTGIGVILSQVAIEDVKFENLRDLDFYLKDPRFHLVVAALVLGATGVAFLYKLFDKK